MRHLHIMAPLVLVAPAIAQPLGAQPEPVAVPVEVVLEDMHAAYAKPTAEEITVRVRTPQGAERTEIITLRLDPGEGPERPRRLGLEMGPLRIQAEQGRLLAVNSAVPGKYLERALEGPPTAGVLARFLPPLPLPQLDLVAGEGKFRAPTPYTTDVVWTSATAQDKVRPNTMMLIGSGPAGPVTATAHLATGRLMRLTASIRSPEGETTLDMTFRSLDASPAPAWTIDTAGRESVATLAELRPTPPKPQGLISPGQTVSEISLSRPDLSAWTLYSALNGSPEAAAEPARPIALLLFRGGSDLQRAAERMRDARAGMAVMRSVLEGKPLAEGEPRSEPVMFAPAAATVIELGEFSRERWEEAARAWAAASVGPEPIQPGDELMWGSSAAQTIERFLPGAGALIAVVAPDRSLRGVVPLDGRAETPQAIAADLRRVLTQPAALPTQEPRP